MRATSAFRSALWFFDESFEIVRADLLFPFNEHDEINRHAAGLLPLRNRFDMCPDLPLVINRPAGVHGFGSRFGLAHRRFKRRRCPLIKRFRRLDVIVPIEQNSRPARLMFVLCQHDGMPAGRQNFGVEFRRASLAASHSAHLMRSGACSGLVLTLGMRRNSLRAARDPSRRESIASKQLVEHRHDVPCGGGFVI